MFEAIMMICFGLSWPANIYKSLRTRFVRGKSPLFMGLVSIGYASGILHKILNPPASDAHTLARYVIILYALNFAMVTFDLILYYMFRKNEERVA
ncbi:MAG: hypothetical protein GX230_10305 [Lentisphaerae bacterium]|nr:hypothetical protein [Lentisphaerota bacterium]